jgi:hypothetical protein
MNTDKIKDFFVKSFNAPYMHIKFNDKISMFLIYKPSSKEFRIDFYYDKDFHKCSIKKLPKYITEDKIILKLEEYILLNI